MWEYAVLHFLFLPLHFHFLIPNDTVVNRLNLQMTSIEWWVLLKSQKNGNKCYLNNFEAEVDNTLWQMLNNNILWKWKERRQQINSLKWSVVARNRSKWYLEDRWVILPIQWLSYWSCLLFRYLQCKWKYWKIQKKIQHFNKVQTKKKWIKC